MKTQNDNSNKSNYFIILSKKIIFNSFVFFAITCLLLSAVILPTTTSALYDFNPLILKCEPIVTDKVNVICSNIELGSSLTIPGGVCIPKIADISGLVSCVENTANSILSNPIVNSTTVLGVQSNINVIYTPKLPDILAPIAPICLFNPTIKNALNLLSVTCADVEPGVKVNIPGTVCAPTQLNTSGIVECIEKVPGSLTYNSTVTTVDISSNSTTSPIVITNTNVDSSTPVPLCTPYSNYSAVLCISVPTDSTLTLMGATCEASKIINFDVVICNEISAGSIPYPVKAKIVDIKGGITYSNEMSKPIVIDPCAQITNPTCDFDKDGVPNLTDLDDDGDTSPDSIEIGDVNGDGIPDAYQSNVTTIKNPNGQLATLVFEGNGDCAKPVQASFIAEASQTKADNNFDYPYGLVSFKVKCPTTTTLTTIWPGLSADKLTNYRKATNLTPGDVSTFGYYDLPVTRLVVNGSQAIKYTLTDGQKGDMTAVDGYIVDPAGPVITATVVDTIPPAKPICIANTTNTVITCSGVETGATVTLPNANCVPTPADSTGIVKCTETSTNSILFPVIVTVKDQAGNIAVSDLVPKSIILVDTTAPNAPMCTVPNVTPAVVNCVNAEPTTTVTLPGTKCEPTPVGIDGKVTCTETTKGSLVLPATLSIKDLAGNTTNTLIPKPTTTTCIPCTNTTASDCKPCPTTPACIPCAGAASCGNGCGTCNIHDVANTNTINVNGVPSATNPFSFMPMYNLNNIFCSTINFTVGPTTINYSPVTNNYNNTTYPGTIINIPNGAVIVTINNQNIKLGDTIILVNGDKVTLNLNGTITIIKANPLDLTITNLIIGYVINNNPVVYITVPVPPSTNSTIIYNINTYNYYNNVVNPGTIINLNIPNGAVIVTINNQNIKLGDTIILVNGDKVTLNLNGTITIIKANPLDTTITNLIIGYVINNNPVVYITVPVPAASNSTIIYNNNTYNTTNNTYNTTNNNYNNPINPGTVINVNIPNGAVIVTINNQNIKLGDTIILANGDKVTLNINGTITIIKANPLDTTVTNLVIGYTINNNPVINITVPVPPTPTSTIIYNSTVYNTTNNYNTNNQNNTIIVTPNLQPGSTIITINGQNITVNQTITLITGDKVTLNVNGTLTVVRVDLTKDLILVLGFVNQAGVNGSVVTTILNNQSSFNQTNNYYSTVINVTGGNNTFNNNTNSSNQVVINLAQVLPQGSNLITINGQTITIGQTITLMSGDKITYNNNGTITIINGNQTTNAPINITLGYTGVNGGGNITINIINNNNQNNTCIVNGVNVCNNNNNCTGNSCNITITLKPNTPPGSTITMIDNIVIIAGQTITLVNGDKITLNIDGTITVVRTNGSLVAGNYTLTVRTSDGKIITGNLTVNFVDPKSNPGSGQGNGLGTVRSGANQNTYVLSFMAIIGFVYLTLNKKYFNKQN